MGPYRTAVERKEAAPPGLRRKLAGDLLVPFAMLWVLSLMRVVDVVLRGQPFGGVDTLAAIALFALPWLVLEHRRR